MFLFSRTRLSKMKIIQVPFFLQLKIDNLKWCTLKVRLEQKACWNHVNKPSGFCLILTQPKALVLIEPGSVYFTLPNNYDKPPLHDESNRTDDSYLIPLCNFRTFYCDCCVYLIDKLNKWNLTQTYTQSHIIACIIQDQSTPFVRNYWNNIFYKAHMPTNGEH